MCNLLPKKLSNLRIAALSLDDLYLPHTGLVQLAADHSYNKMLSGRGPAGTHDLQLGQKLFQEFLKINESVDGVVQVPIFDKSLFGGRGDRVSETVEYKGPIDVVILEGWMLGFSPLPTQSLAETYKTALESPAEAAKANGLDYSPPFFLQHSLKDLEFIESELKHYEGALWKYLNCFVTIRPKEMGYVWEWRLEVRTFSAY